MLEGVATDVLVAVTAEVLASAVAVLANTELGRCSVK